MQPLFFGNNILHLLPYLKCFFRAGCKSLPAVIVRDPSRPRGGEVEPVKFRYRRLKSGWEVARQAVGVVVNHCVSSLRTPGAATAREDVWISGGTTL